MKQKIFLYLIIATLLCPIISLNAQITSSPIEDPYQSLNITTVPEYPAPYSNITVEVNTYAFDIQSAVLTWFVNGKKVESGQGKTRVSTQLGNFGEKTEITIQVQRQSGSSFSNSITIYPTDIDLIWQAKTYTPNFYKGKALATYGSEIRVSANPIIQTGKTLIPKEQLTYLWSIDGSVSPSDSGYGKYSMEYPATVTSDSNSISVLVSVPNTSIEAFAEIEIPLSNPSVLVYEDHPLFGLQSQNALTNSGTLYGKETTFKAIPFFFSAPTPTFSGLEYSWNLNGKKIDTLSPDNLTLRNEEGGSGKASVGVEITNMVKNSQYGLTNFLLNFGNNE